MPGSRIEDGGGVFPIPPEPEIHIICHPKLRAG
jgi:hypothetical protein